MVDSHESAAIGQYLKKFPLLSIQNTQSQSERPPLHVMNGRHVLIVVVKFIILINILVTLQIQLAISE